MNIGKIFYPISALSISFMLTLSVTASALQTPEKPAKKQNIFIEADRLDYEHVEGIVTASGKVEILKGETVLFADKITYNQKTNIVEAEGNVALAGPDGNAVFVDKFTLKDDLSEGVIKYFRARLDDGSLIAAAEAKRINESRIEMKKAVYSPCPVCEATPESDPQWQIKAEEVELDEIEQTVTYHDAFLEVYGTPVLYTPYFRHPTPGADRKSGLLMPELSSDSNLGTTLTVPYYFNLAPNYDVTLAPTITTDEGLILAGEFNHLTNYGEYHLNGSFTRPRKFSELASSEQDKEWRGHIKGNGLFDITENWDFGFRGELSSDDTYLRKYNFNNTDMLTSRAYFERIKERNYSIIQTVYFQGLLEQDDNDRIPFALPYIRNHFETEKGILPYFSGSRLYMDLSGFAVSREVGTDNQRVSLSGGAIIPYITSGGHVLEAQATLRGDYYNQDDLLAGRNGEKTRFIPEASIKWSLPLVKQFEGGGSMTLEPTAKIVFSPSEDYNDGIVNEDSQDVEFSDLNLFSNNRFRGLDQVESGTRAYYGLRGGYYEDEVDISYTFGQNYRFKEPQNLPRNTGFEDNASDFVGRVGVNLYNTLDLSYRFRLDKDNLAARRNEVDATLDYSPVMLNLNYLSLDYDLLDPTDNREEITGNAQVKLDDEWSVLFSGRRNLNDKQNIDAATGIRYEGECVDITASVRREFISDRDFEAGTSFDLKIGLKNLGEL
ncbi:MAG: hypothetical protein COV36_07685 [Alphaproteobacteria bacterium CG11_big_fil_rev_8_21_14_0_20_44_7]|nr:MAG: hypothetical protein COV36_07685 [Alphaproteobacteria bacterium CG11_big_fil_rev_8_21_14_0_20_44_7]